MKISDLERLQRVRRYTASGAARSLRDDAGLSQAEVAAAVGVSQSTVALWEAGKRSPRGLAALKYATVLDGLARSASTPRSAS